MLLKIKPDEAFRLSFFAGIFATFSDFGLNLIVSKSNFADSITGLGLAGLVVAIIASTVISLFLIDFLIKVAWEQKITYLTTVLGAIAIVSGLLYSALSL
jgi:undecaprenyl pyrophosphate phosphatase UppP